MHLRRSRLDSLGFRRVRCGRGFRYLGLDDQPVSDEATLERIRALVIPPAWTDVWICPVPNGHIQAVGTDAAGRRQYRYHESWTKRRMVEFARALPELRTKVLTDLALPGLPRDRVLAVGIRLLDVGMFRIGGEEYTTEHETYGAATIEKRHVRIRDGAAHLAYPAKGGKRRQITITDAAIVAALAQLKTRRAGGPALLAWRVEGHWHDVTSDDLNAYLKERSGGDFTAKDFRTWNASLLAAALCAAAPAATSRSARARRAATVVREVAESLGNTPAVCRKSYIDPRVLERFECGETVAAALNGRDQPVDLADGRYLAELEAAVIALVVPDQRPHSAAA